MHHSFLHRNIGQKRLKINSEFKFRRYESRICKNLCVADFADHNNVNSQIPLKLEYAEFLNCAFNFDDEAFFVRPWKAKITPIMRKGCAFIFVLCKISCKRMNSAKMLMNRMSSTFSTGKNVSST